MKAFGSGDSVHLLPELHRTDYSYAFRTIPEESTDRYVRVERVISDRLEAFDLLRLAPHIQLFIGVGGCVGAGKSTVAKLLEEKGVYVATSHGLVADDLRAKGFVNPEMRELLQSHGSHVGRLAPTAWVNGLIGKVNSQNKPVAVWDGIRFPHDPILSRLAAGGRYFLDRKANTMNLVEKGRFEMIFVDADHDKRQKLYLSRARVGDGRTEEMFHRQEFADERIFMLTETSYLRDHLINNAGGIGDLIKKVDTLWNQMLQSRGIILC